MLARQYKGSPDTCPDSAQTHADISVSESPAVWERNVRNDIGLNSAWNRQKNKWGYQGQAKFHDAMQSTLKFEM